MVTVDQREYIQREFKIPVDSINPSTYWILSLDAESNMPTDDELRQLQSYCEFSALKIYAENQAKIILEKDLPSAPTCNTIIFLKGNWGEEGDHDAWFYRKSSWNQGPLFVPYHREEENYHPHTLVEIMDRYETIGKRPISERWTAWKEEHPEIFPITEEGVR